MTDTSLSGTVSLVMGASVGLGAAALLLAAGSPSSGWAAAKPKKVLVVTTTTGFRHSSIETAERIIEKLGEKRRREAQREWLRKQARA